MGLYSESKELVINDDCKKKANAHKVLSLLWAGTTTFESIEPGQFGGSRSKIKWAGIEYNEK